MNGGTPEKDGSTAQKRLSMSFVVSLMALCERHAKKIKLRTRNLRRTHLEHHLKRPRFGITGDKYDGGGGRYDWCTPPRSPLRARSKELFTSLSNKAMTMVRRKSPGHGGGERYDWCTPPRSPLRARSKELFTSLSNKAITMVRRKNPGHGGGESSEKQYAAEEEEEYGVWRRTILMGDKCQPLDFSGVIYYDSNGRQLKELPPRSPRGNPLLNHTTRSFVGSPLNPMVTN